VPNGKICYIEFPALSIEISSAFYHDVFGWKLRNRSDGVLAFDDTTGQVSGTWVLDRAPNTSGMLVYIMVNDAEATVAAIRAHGGEIVQEIGVHPTETLAWFRDPAGNVLGVYQSRS
jgi:predicted enzyme related to lactoylglutathione lyase